MFDGDDSDDEFLDDADDDYFAPVPHPDDRLWRHPSEIAAMHAAERAHAEAETRRVPAVADVAASDGSGRVRLHRGMAAAAAVVVLGASAVVLGVWSAASNPTSVIERAGVALADGSNRLAGGPDRPADEANSLAAPIGEPVAGVELAVDQAVDPITALELRLHEELSGALPLVQAAAGDDMREGSGLMVAADGHVVTSAGLVAESDYVLVWTDDGRRFPATVVGLDPISDIAVVQVDPAAITGTVPFDGQGDLRVGQYAITIDHDLDSMRVGEVLSPIGATAVDRGDPADRLVISPGALPGAAIVDDTGSVFAVANHAPGDTVYATRAATVEWVVQDLIALGAVEHPWVGVRVDPIESSGAVVVTEVIDGSPAARANVRVGDVIDSVDGIALNGPNSMWALVGRHRPGDRVDFIATRSNSRRIISVIAGSHLDAPVD